MKRLAKAIAAFCVGTGCTWCAIAVDTQVANNQAQAATTVVSPQFSTASSPELLLAFVSTDYLSGTNTTVTNVSGAGLTWTLVARANAQRGSSEIWRAIATSPLSGVTLSATLSQAVVSSITVVAFNGVDSSGTNGSGAVGATATGAPRRVHRLYHW